MSEVNINYKGSTIASMDASGTKTLQTSGKYCEDDVEVVYTRPTPPVPSYQTKSVTPSESAQTVTADSGYDALEEVDVGAISSTYVGSSITRRSSTDLTASGATVTVPAGYYASQASKAVATGTAGTPTATKGTVSSHSISVTPSVTNTAGYISGGTKTGTAVTVSASELVSGALNITSNGAKDVTNYATVNVTVRADGLAIGKDSVTNVSSTTTSLTFAIGGTPQAFALRYNGALTTSSSTRNYITAIFYDGQSTMGNYWRTSGTYYADETHYSFTYSSTTRVLTIKTSSSRSSAGGSFYNGQYDLIYVYSS